MAINLFRGRCWPLWVSLSGVCGTRQLAWWLVCDITQHKENTKYRSINWFHKKAKVALVFPNYPMSLCAKVHVSDSAKINQGQDKLKGGSHLTTFNNTISETDPICLVDEEMLLLFLDLIKISNVFNLQCRCFGWVIAGRCTTSTIQQEGNLGLQADHSRLTHNLCSVTWAVYTFREGRTVNLSSFFFQSQRHRH